MYPSIYLASYVSMYPSIYLASYVSMYPSIYLASYVSMSMYVWTFFDICPSENGCKRASRHSLMPFCPDFQKWPGTPVL